MYRTKEKGFSFIEILVVVTIIGIIATIGLVTYTEFLKQSRDAKRKGDIEQIRAAIEIYKTTNSYRLST
jgi:general secretion pathway protein G